MQYCRKWLTGRSVWQRAVCQWAYPHQCSRSAAHQGGWCCRSLQTTHPASGPDPQSSWPDRHTHTHKKQTNLSTLMSSDSSNWYFNIIIYLPLKMLVHCLPAGCRKRRDVWDRGHLAPPLHLWVAPQWLVAAGPQGPSAGTSFHLAPRTNAPSTSRSDTHWGNLSQDQKC